MHMKAKDQDEHVYGGRELSGTSQVGKTMSLRVKRMKNVSVPDGTGPCERHTLTEERKKKYEAMPDGTALVLDGTYG